jgi:phage tail-like protein
MAVRDYEQKRLFRIEIEGFNSAEFKTCSEVGTEFDEAKIREGGRALEFKEIGNATIPNITLTRGSSSDTDFQDWTDEQLNQSTGFATSNNPKRNIDIVQLNLDGTDRYRDKGMECHIVDIKKGDWDNDASEFVIESVIISVGYWL